MDCKRVTVIRIGPVFSTKKALYFVGSMVLFFLLKLIFFLGGGGIASSAPFSKRNVCRPVFQQAAASSPSIDAAKGGGLPQ